MVMCGNDMLQVMTDHEEVFGRVTIFAKFAKHILTVR